MCGFTGFVSNSLDLADLEWMTNKLAHRGPDARGVWLDRNPGVGLGHQRLSILDLSDASNQPFFSASGQSVLAYNGEVYNYRELSKQSGLTPRTSSDTEVVVELLEKEGPDALNRFNGMFSGAVWDKRRERLLLFRDRLGIKPLFVLQNERGLLFASEMKALIPFVDPGYNREAVAAFLHVGYTPGAMTFLPGVSKLPAGSYGIYENGKFDVIPFWSVEESVNPDLFSGSEDEAVLALETLLQSSVQYRMISDVPLGVFLSGGIDSSTVAAVAQSQSSRPVKSFSIGFTDGKYNEAGYARAVATHLGTEHHEFLLSESEAVERVSQLQDVFDEPFSDSSAIPTMLVSEMARKHVTVALSGDGGDELFHGYGMYTWAKRLSNPFVRAFRSPIAWALESSGNNRNRRAAGLFRFDKDDFLPAHIFSQEGHLFSAGEIANLLTPQRRTAVKWPQRQYSRSVSPVEEQALFDLEYYLRDDLLVKVDRASMLYGLEVRVPLLDHRIVEFAANLPEEMKTRGPVKKYLLKQVLYKHVPAELFDRPKWGFSIPLQKWLKTDLKYLVDRYLDPQQVEDTGIVRVDQVEKLKTAYYDQNRGYLYNRVWSLVLLHQWISEKR